MNEPLSCHHACHLRSMPSAKAASYRNGVSNSAMNGEAYNDLAMHDNANWRAPVLGNPRRLFGPAFNPSTHARELAECGSHLAGHT